MRRRAIRRNFCAIFAQFGIARASPRSASRARYELLDSRCNLLHVTAESDPDLFRALPWSHGTLGFLTAVTVKLQKTKPYVRVKYVPTSSPAELTATLQKFARARGTDAPEFLEATMYTKDDAVVQAAWYADAPAAG